MLLRVVKGRDLAPPGLARAWTQRSLQMFRNDLPFAPCLTAQCLQEDVGGGVGMEGPECLPGGWGDEVLGDSVYTANGLCACNY